MDNYNNYNLGNPVPTREIIRRIRLMTSAGGMLTRERLRTLTLAADRLDEYQCGLYNEEGDKHEEH